MPVGHVIGWLGFGYKFSGYRHLTKFCSLRTLKKNNLLTAHDIDASISFCTYLLAIVSQNMDLEAMFDSRLEFARITWVFMSFLTRDELGCVCLEQVGRRRHDLSWGWIRFFNPTTSLLLNVESIAILELLGYAGRQPVITAAAADAPAPIMPGVSQRPIQMLRWTMSPWNTSRRR